ncbi:Aspartate ammonia-lyase [Sodalis praecaptivus]
MDVFQGGAGTSVNMNTNEVLANIGLELMGHQKGEYQFLNPNDHLNLCQSTNDAYPTGFRLAVYHALQRLVEAIDYLGAGFEKKRSNSTAFLKWAEPSCRTRFQ